MTEAFPTSVWMMLVAGVFAFLAAACIGSTLWEQRERTRTMRRVDASGIGDSADGPQALRGINDRLIAFCEAVSRKVQLGVTKPLAPASPRATAWYEKHMPKAGLAAKITCVGFCEARRRIAIGGLVGGALLGAVFSTELAGLLGFVGFISGWYSLSGAVRGRVKTRTEELERHLSEMLEVVALGLRSGLSFDRSLQLYMEHFSTLLSLSIVSAQRQWALGLVMRDEALRSLASTYDSALFTRVIENIVRSLRYGSSLAESLEAAAAEARTEYRARKQEQVAKAPVKMMVPTGALMLPAMLLLVLGPVLLELMEGF